MEPHKTGWGAPSSAAVALSGGSNVLSLTSVIEPSAGAERTKEKRSGVHELWNSDEYRSVWWTVPLDGLGHDGVKDAASIAEAQRLLARLKRHSDPVLRHYGWTVKHLKEHVGGPGGMCYHDRQGTADITLQLRQRPSRQCNAFRSFRQLMGVMIHEMTHISGLGIEDVHPPEFYEKNREVWGVYKRLLADGVSIVEGGKEGGGAAGEGEDFGEGDGSVEGGCRSKRRLLGGGGGGGGRRRSRARGGPSGSSGAGGGKRKKPALGRKQKMIDKRTVEGKQLAAAQASRTPAEAARQAALARVGQQPLSAREATKKRLRETGGDADTAIELGSSDDDDNDEGDDGDGLFAPMEMIHEDTEEFKEGDEEDEDELHDGELHDGPPGFCLCSKCA